MGDPPNATEATAVPVQAAVAVPVVAEATAVPVQAAVAVPVVAAPAVAVAPAGGGGGCCSGNKAIHITQMTFGIFNILSGLNAVSPLNELPFYEWGVVAFLLGISSMVAASMYNPCLCCPCGTPTTATKLKTIAVVSMAAGVLALVGVIVFGVTLGDISASDWGAVAEYTCCPGEAVAVTAACAKSNCKSDWQGDDRCWAEAMKCKGDKVPIVWKNGLDGCDDDECKKLVQYKCCPAGATEITSACAQNDCLDITMDCILGPQVTCKSSMTVVTPVATGAEKDFKETKGGKDFYGFVFVVMIIGIVWCIVSAVVSFAAGFLTWGEAKTRVVIAYN